LEEITFPGNANLLDAIWKNLIDNAVKYSLQGGAVKLYLTQQDNQALFIIQDDGLGMDQHTKSHIFERFYQGDTSHAPQGHGLGLALVKRVVELYHGTITVESNPGQGSTFFVQLPFGTK